MRGRWLEPGDVYRLPADCYPPDFDLERRPVFEVLRVNAGSATVRNRTKQAVHIEAADGEVADFDRPGRPFLISPTAAVELITEGG